MTRQSAYELRIAAVCLVLGAIIEAFAPPWYPIGWVIGVFLIVGAIVVALDAFIWPNDPPSPVFLAGAYLAAAWLLSP